LARATPLLAFFTSTINNFFALRLYQHIKSFGKEQSFNKLLLGLFVIAVIFSYIIHLNFRKKHYQECDSTLVYYLFQDQPQKGLIYANWNFALAPKPLSKNVIEKLFANNWREQKITNEILNDEVDFHFKKDEIDFQQFKNELNAKKSDSDFLKVFGLKNVDSLLKSKAYSIGQFDLFLANQKLSTACIKYIDSTRIPSKIRTTYQKSVVGNPVDSIQLCKLNRLLLEQLFPKSIQKIAIREIIQNKISFQQLYRILEVYGTDEFISNKPIKQSMQFALGSTYSPAVGLCYYFILQSTSSFNEFLSVTLILTITLFHLSALLIVWLLIGSRFSPFAAVFTGILFLFSISLYSYSFHLGSTIWNVFTAIVWLYAYASSIHRGNIKQRRIISMTTGVLLFFNYLIFFYWLAFMLLQLFMLWKQTEKRKFNSVFKLAFSQWFFMIMFTIVMIVFYQAAQGNRGNMQTFRELYSVVLNYFAFFNQYAWLTVVQFLFAFVCIVQMVIYLFQLLRKKMDKEDSKDQLAYYFISFCFVLLFTLAFKLLGIAASRHILWITPIFFLCFAFSFDQIKTQKKGMLLIPFGFMVLGFVGIFERQKQTLNNKDYAWEQRKDVDQFLVHDFIFDVYYNLKEKNQICTWSDDYTKLQKGKRYMFISQTHTFQQYADSIAPILQQKNIQIEVLKTTEKMDYHRFVAYAPVAYFHDRSNSIYVTEFLTK
jgi:hypothetical protein